MQDQHYHFGRGGGDFPTTHWSELWSLRDSTEEERAAILNRLCARYWPPVYGYLRASGCSKEDAEDFTQGFFLHCLKVDLFERAVEEECGRFRNFVLKCLRNRVLDDLRRAAAKKRRPPGGFVSLEKLAEESGMDFEVPDRETPESMFDRAWMVNQVHRALERFRTECDRLGRPELIKILVWSLVRPALDGSRRVPAARIGERLGLTEKQVGHQLEAAKKNFRRVLEHEVQFGCSTDSDSEQEMGEILDMLGFS